MTEEQFGTGLCDKKTVCDWCKSHEAMPATKTNKRKYTDYLTHMAEDEKILDHVEDDSTGWLYASYGKHLLGDGHLDTSQPLSIQLPALIRYKHKTGELWAILMHFELKKTSKKPRYEGIVYVCANQRSPPPIWMGFDDMWKWALDLLNVPMAFRYNGLAHALTDLCSPGGLYPVEYIRSDGYFQGPKCWQFVEWDMTIEEVVKYNIPIYNYVVELLPKDIPLKPRPMTISQKKLQIKAQDKLLESLDPDLLLDLSLFD